MNINFPELQARSNISDLKTFLKYQRVEMTKISKHIVVKFNIIKDSKIQSLNEQLDIRPLNRNPGSRRAVEW